ncbi:3-phenylpropionate/cinnamic acid dioxygenase, small subunit [Klenkia marina]|uniref:3-phenylpropionate/cinnamic acid dioxygenase, small subunit n=1 Tax=Klenkia marina TaxID=1960309 RepID=A0A1G4YLX3_9ACTN|nr:aromatic-ring-hydroxylating dioxygenase subunit beta [Klenkia marina]SCX54486.1 3-phenylpropionate/cinnamic acid dioxygenase, small subunit [Klenkia marina]
MTETTSLRTAVAGVPLTDPRVVRAIELVWREAELLDRADYTAWDALYAEDGTYVVPIDGSVEEFDDVLNMVYDDTRMRRMRIVRMTEGHALAAVDAARTVRTVSRFVPAVVSDDEVVLRSAQVLVAYKRGRHDLWVGDVEHRIRLSETGDRIVRKVVRLVDSEGAPPAAGFLL